MYRLESKNRAGLWGAGAAEGREDGQLLLVRHKTMTSSAVSIASLEHAIALSRKNEDALRAQLDALKQKASTFPSRLTGASGFDEIHRFDADSFAERVTPLSPFHSFSHPQQEHRPSLAGPDSGDPRISEASQGYSRSRLPTEPLLQALEAPMSRTYVSGANALEERLIDELLTDRYRCQPMWNALRTTAGIFTARGIFTAWLPCAAPHGTSCFAECR